MKLLAISVNPVDLHKEWIQDINAYSHCTVEYPIVADPERKIAKAFDMLPAEVRLTSQLFLVERAWSFQGSDSDSLTSV